MVYPFFPSSSKLKKYILPTSLGEITPCKISNICHCNRNFIYIFSYDIIIVLFPFGVLAIHMSQIKFFKPKLWSDEGCKTSETTLIKIAYVVKNLSIFPGFVLYTYTCILFFIQTYMVKAIERNVNVVLVSLLLTLNIFPTIL